MRNFDGNKTAGNSHDQEQNARLEAEKSPRVVAYPGKNQNIPCVLFKISAN